MDATAAATRVVMTMTDKHGSQFKLRGDGPWHLGRASTCDVTVDHKAVSSQHASVARDSGGAFLLSSTGRNGTWVNGAKVVAPVALPDGAEVVLANNSGLALRVAILAGDGRQLKRDATEVNGALGTADAGDDDDDDGDGGVTPVKRAASAKKRPKMRDDLTCGICQDVFHQPITLWPCMHTFCGGCLASWLDRSEDCPMCRVHVEALRPNLPVRNVADTFLEENPDMRRDAVELADMDKKYEAKIKPRLGDALGVRSKQGRGRSFSGSGSGSDDSSGGGGGGGFFGFMPFAMQLPFGLGAMAAAARQCRECVNARAGDGYKCASPHPQHVVCSYCQQTFPSRNWPGTTCVGCTRSSCHPYFGDCGGGGDQLKPLRDHIPAAMPVGAILGIKCETDWFASYLSSKGIALAQVWTDCVDKLAANVFKSTKWPNATDSSTFCSGCAVMVQRELLLQYRRGVPNDDVGPKRSNCHWGEACRTAAHNDNHATRFNHLCPQTRFN